MRMQEYGADKPVTNNGKVILDALVIDKRVLFKSGHGDFGVTDTCSCDGHTRSHALRDAGGMGGPVSKVVHRFGRWEE